jgi:Recombination endonuclease VII
MTARRKAAVIPGGPRNRPGYPAGAPDLSKMTKPACWYWPEPAADAMERMRERWEQEAPGVSVGMTEEEWRWYLMAEWQGNRCAICGVLAIGRMRLVTDHDHKTALIRGLLCIGCNVREGYGGGDVYDMYRQRNPASICKARIIYYDYFRQQEAVPQVAPAPEPLVLVNPVQGELW